MTAYTIDIYIVSFIHIGIGLLIFPLSFFFSLDSILEWYNKIDLVMEFFLTLVVYFLLQEMFWHKTIGKKLVKIEIVNKDGGKPRIYQVIIRNIFKVIDTITVIGMAWVFIDDKNRRLGDIVSKTMIVETQPNHTVYL